MHAQRMRGGRGGAALHLFGSRHHSVHRPDQGGPRPRRRRARRHHRRVLHKQFCLDRATIGLPSDVLSGSLIVESLFDFPGVGLLFWNSAENRDYPVLLGVVLVVTLATVIGKLLADIGYSILDPRVRLK